MMEIAANPTSAELIVSLFDGRDEGDHTEPNIMALSKRHFLSDGYGIRSYMEQVMVLE